MSAPTAIFGILSAAAAAAIPVSEAASLDASTTVTVGAAIAVTSAIVAAAWRMASAQATAQANLSTTIEGMRTDVNELKDAIEENISRDEFVGWLRVARAKGMDLPEFD